MSNPIDIDNLAINTERHIFLYSPGSRSIVSCGSLSSIFAPFIAQASGNRTKSQKWLRFPVPVSGAIYSIRIRAIIVLSTTLYSTVQ
jgi:hypothetical protein